MSSALSARQALDLDSRVPHARRSFHFWRSWFMATMRARFGQDIKASFCGVFDVSGTPAGGTLGGSIALPDARRRIPRHTPRTRADSNRDGRHVAARWPSAAFLGSTWRPCPPSRVTAECTRAKRNSSIGRDWFRRHLEDFRPGRTRQSVTFAKRDAASRLVVSHRHVSRYVEM